MPGADHGSAPLAPRRPGGLTSDRSPFSLARFDSPLGSLDALLSPRGVVSLLLPGSRDGREAARQARPIEQAPAAARAHARALGRELNGYFAGTLRRFRVPLDLSLASPFTRAAMRALERTVPRGATVTYAELARRMGAEGAARAVGQAMRRNPLPIVIPCHRVVATDGGLGGYSGGGVTTKRRLLALEEATPRGAPAPRRRRLDDPAPAPRRPTPPR